MWTSGRPDSLDVYATNWPSGEKVPCHWSPGAERKRVGFGSPVSGNSHRSSSGDVVVEKSRCRPSRDQSDGNITLDSAPEARAAATDSTGSSLPPPPALLE